MGPMETRIRQKIESSLAPIHLELINESHMHSVPANSETHFKLIVVSNHFEGKSRIDRARLIHEILDLELKGGVHALTHKTWTPAEFAAAGNTIELASPECHGGSRNK